MLKDAIVQKLTVNWGVWGAIAPTAIKTQQALAGVVSWRAFEPIFGFAATVSAQVIDCSFIVAHQHLSFGVKKNGATPMRHGIENFSEGSGLHARQLDWLKWRLLNCWTNHSLTCPAANPERGAWILSSWVILQRFTISPCPTSWTKARLSKNRTRLNCCDTRNKCENLLSCPSSFA